MAAVAVVGPSRHLEEVVLSSIMLQEGVFVQLLSPMSCPSGPVFVHISSSAPTDPFVICKAKLEAELQNQQATCKWRYS